MEILPQDIIAGTRVCISWLKRSSLIFGSPNPATGQKRVCVATTRDVRGLVTYCKNVCMVEVIPWYQFSTGSIFTPQGTFGHIWRHLWLSRVDEVLLTSSESRPKMLLDTLQLAGQPPRQNGSRASVEKPCCMVSLNISWSVNYLEIFNTSNGCLHLKKDLRDQTVFKTQIEPIRQKFKSSQGRLFVWNWIYLLPQRLDHVGGLHN